VRAGSARSGANDAAFVSDEPETEPERQDQATFAPHSSILHDLKTVEASLDLPGRDNLVGEMEW
jgi:hypothetical protein